MKLLIAIDDIKVFKLERDSEKFKEIDISQNIIKDILDHESSLIFIDYMAKIIWLWYGSKTDSKIKFIAARIAPSIRDVHAIGFKISAIDQDNEPDHFKLLIGI